MVIESKIVKKFLLRDLKKLFFKKGNFGWFVRIIILKFGWVLIVLLGSGVVLLFVKI